jgi:hypothetical protein
MESKARAIASSNNPEAQEVATLLDVSATNVSVASLGVRMFKDPSSFAEPGDSATPQKAAMLMVFGGGKTSIDLCASALLRWRGVVSGDQKREPDLHRLNQEIKKGFGLASSTKWYDEVMSADGQRLVKFRHANAHRYIIQSVTVTPGAAQPHLATIASARGEPHEDMGTLLERLAGLSEELWIEFWASMQ